MHSAKDASSLLSQTSSGTNTRGGEGSSEKSRVENKPIIADILVLLTGLSALEGFIVDRLDLSLSLRTSGAVLAGLAPCVTNTKIRVLAPTANAHLKVLMRAFYH